MELNTVVLRGRVGSDVAFKQEQDSKPYARFRMAVSRSRRTDDGTWEEMESSWYTVKAWGVLARHVMLAVRKGQPIVVVGRPAAQAWKNDDNQVFSALAIHAITVGHDLGFGISTYSRLDRDSEGRGAGSAPSGVNSETGVISEEVETKSAGPSESPVNSDAPRENTSPGSGLDETESDGPPF